VEKRLAMDPTILLAMVIGEQRPYLTALVVANEGALGSHWQREEGRALPSDWRSSDEVKSWLLSRMQIACHDLPSFMQVRYFMFVDEEWTQGSGMLTPTLKFKRRNIMQRHQSEIDAMYAQAG
jgi:long-chain acyl-CoA synthetase